MALEAVNSAIDDTKRTAEIVRRIRFMFKRHEEHKTAIGVGALIDDVVKLVAGEARSARSQCRLESRLLCNESPAIVSSSSSAC